MTIPPSSVFKVYIYGEVHIDGLEHLIQVDYEDIIVVDIAPIAAPDFLK